MADPTGATGPNKPDTAANGEMPQPGDALLTTGKAPAPDLSEIGSLGLKRTSGHIIEEPLVTLRGQRGRKVYAEMATDAIVGAWLFALEKVLGRLTWEIVSGDENQEQDPVAEFVQSCFEDMSEPFTTTLGEILTCVIYGWQYSEILYKRRIGPDETDGTRRSRYTDGKIGWRRFAPRAQDTLWQWMFDVDGGIAGMVQVDPWVGGGRREIPIEKALLFRTTSRRGNPEGVSMLRSAFRPWYFKKRLEEIEAVGVERDLAGLPVAWVPPEYLDPAAPAAVKDVLASITNIVQNVKRNEQEGVVFPLLYDDKGNKIFDLTLLSTGGQRQFNTNEIIGRYDQRIAMSVIADWLLLGHENVGSFALGTTKMDMWTMAVDALAKAVADVINLHAIPRLLRLNAVKVDVLPRLVYGDVSQVDLTAIADFVTKNITAGVITPDDDLEKHLRDIAGLPPAENAQAHADAQAQQAAATEQDGALVQQQMTHADAAEARTQSESDQKAAMADQQMIAANQQMDHADAQETRAADAHLQAQAATVQSLAQGAQQMEQADQQMAQQDAQAQMAAESHATTQDGAKISQAQQKVTLEQMKKNPQTPQKGGTPRGK